jgi:hypothetical protein
MENHIFVTGVRCKSVFFFSNVMKLEVPISCKPELIDLASHSTRRSWPTWTRKAVLGRVNCILVRGANPERIPESRF